MNPTGHANFRPPLPSGSHNPTRPLETAMNLIPPTLQHYNTMPVQQQQYQIPQQEERCQNCAKPAPLPPSHPQDPQHAPQRYQNLPPQQYSQYSQPAPQHHPIPLQQQYHEYSQPAPQHQPVHLQQQQQYSQLAPQYHPVPLQQHHQYAQPIPQHHTVPLQQHHEYAQPIPQHHTVPLQQQHQYSQPVLQQPVHPEQDHQYSQPVPQHHHVTSQQRHSQDSHPVLHDDPESVPAQPRQQITARQSTTSPSISSLHGMMSVAGSPTRRPDTKRRRVEDVAELPLPQDTLSQYMNEMLDNVHKMVKAERPPVYPIDLMATLPDPTYDETYTAEDEVRLQQEWQQDPMRDITLRLSGTTRSLGRLTRLSVRLWPGIFPEHIISEWYGLEFEQDPDVPLITIGGREYMDRRWPTAFCNTLGLLLCHPFWSADLQTMAMCIQYAVLCRTGGFRKGCWLRENLTDSKFLDVLHQVTDQNQDGTRAIVDLHEEARQRSAPSRISRLFLEIEKLAFRRDSPDPAAEAMAPFKVRVADLQTVVTALDSVHDMGINYHLPSKVYEEVLKQARQGRGAPFDRDLHLYRERAILDIRRSRIRAQRAAGRVK